MKKPDAGDLFFIVIGVLILAFAAVIALSAYGHFAIPRIVIGAAGIAIFTAGLLSGGVLGAVLGIIAITLIVRFIEAFAIPMAAILGLAGIGMIIFGSKENN